MSIQTIFGVFFSHYMCFIPVRCQCFSVHTKNICKHIYKNCFVLLNSNFRIRLAFFSFTIRVIFSSRNLFQHSKTYCLSNKHTPPPEVSEAQEPSHKYKCFHVVIADLLCGQMVGLAWSQQSRGTRERAAGLGLTEYKPTTHARTYMQYMNTHASFTSTIFFSCSSLETQQARRFIKLH